MTRGTPEAVTSLVREVARTYVHDPDPNSATQSATPQIQELLSIGDLVPFATNRSSARQTPDTEGVPSYWLYYDPGFGMMVMHFAHRQGVPVHDHGTWELLAVISGRLDYQRYHRVDGGDTPSHAKLEVVASRDLKHGDIDLMNAPPYDIHSWAVMEPDTWVLGLVGPGLSKTRRYFDLETSTYVEK